MNTITRHYVGSVEERGLPGLSERAARVLYWLEQAHSRRPRQEFWQWLHAQVRNERSTAN